MAAIVFTLVACTADSPAPADLPMIPLYGGVAPGSESVAYAEVNAVVLGERRSRNVSRPTLTVYAPAAGTATGSAVVVAPGGGFMMLSMQSEGEDVARWLAARGVTAFLLKYRLNETPASNEAFVEQWGAQLSGTAPVGNVLEAPIVKLATDDGLTAVRLVRAQAARWGLNADRIGIVGFSAGARVAMGVAMTYDAASRPDFVASIYGAMPEGASVPADAPPAFVMVAADDPLLAHASVPIYEAWRKADRQAELHVFATGGHGFGMNKQNTTSDYWPEAFGWWLDSLGWLKPTGK